MRMATTPDAATARRRRADPCMRATRGVGDLMQRRILAALDAKEQS